MEFDQEKIIMDITKFKSKAKIVCKIIPYIIAAASAIAALTPNVKDDKFMETVGKIINIAALNVMHADPQNYGDEKSNKNDSQ